MKSKFNIFGVVVAVFAVLLGLFAGKLFETNTAGYYKVKQAFCTGDMTVRNTPGTYMQLFGDITTYDYADNIFLSADELDGGDEEVTKATRVQFPNGYADIDLVAMYELDIVDITHQMCLHNRYNNNKNVKSMVRQQILEVLMNTATLMSAEEAYSTKRSEFINLAVKQLKEGLYTPKVDIEQVTIGGQNSIIKHYSVLLDSVGKPIIKKESILSKYGITISQFNVKGMEFDPKTTALIDARKDAQKSVQDAITAKAKGEATIATEKAKQEVLKIKEVTQMEKEKAVAILKAEKEKEVATLAAKTALENKKRVIAEGQAQAESNRLKVAAGLTPQEKAEWDYKKHVDGIHALAEGLSRVKYPAVMTFGGGKGMPTDPIQALGIKSMLDISNRIKQ